MTEPILDAVGVCKTYRGAVEVEVLKGIDLKVFPGYATCAGTSS